MSKIIENNMNTLLKFAHLSEKHQNIYENLLKSGTQSVAKIALKNGLKRGITYKILDDLEMQGLVIKEEKSKKIFYSPASPYILKKIIEQKEFEIEQEKKVFDSILHKYISQFNLLEGKPTVEFFEGVDGLKKVYEDILIEKTDIKLLRSFLDDKHPKMLEMIEKQIEKQVQKNIHAQIISPIQRTKEQDKERLTTRKILSEQSFSIPAQIMLYGKHKVAITTFDEHMITALIESKGTRETFDQIFKILWGIALPPQY